MGPEQWEDLRPLLQGLQLGDLLRPEMLPLLQGVGRAGEVVRGEASPAPH